MSKLRNSVCDGEFRICLGKIHRYPFLFDKNWPQNKSWPNITQHTVELNADTSNNAKLLASKRLL